MAPLHSLPFAALLVSAAAQVYLSPPDDILSPSSNTATEPLKWLGGNGPYYAGPNVNGVENKVPEGCTVDQVFYIARHGSRYPDSGAYDGWVALYNKIQAANFTASGDLKFLKSWTPVLTNPQVQITNESPTGWKELYDLGYRLRTKFPQLYKAGTPFYTWANLYPRVVASAQNFVRGFLGETAASLGTVVTIDAKGGPDAVFDSLGPSDLCPNYSDLNGGTYATQWDSIYLPPITKRFQALINGDLVLADSDVSSFPYLCGFESQITGILSPFCSTFNDEELRQYQYRQDLRYYYGSGPGTDLQSKMMLPFFNSVVERLAKGPGQKGIKADGSEFDIPNLLTAFTNDGQMTQLIAALGVFDDQTPLAGDAIPTVWKYMSSRFISMRGTVALERYTCDAKASTPASSSTTTASRTIATPPLCSVTPAIATKACNRDNCFRQVLQNDEPAATFCATYTQDTKTASTELPTFVSQCQGSASRISSVCSCLHPPTATPCSTTASSTSSAQATSTPTSGNKNTFIRILLNDAVYPLPACQDGPGKTCGMEAYKNFIKGRLQNAGDLKARCNVTAAPDVLKGASFFEDLRSSKLAFVKP